MKINNCPWCKRKPEYMKTTLCANYDDAGNRYKTLRDLPTEHIECVNTDCEVRPHLIRINTGDAFKIWNKC